MHDLYSTFACQPHPAAGDIRSATVAKKISRKRVKSAFRDAHFRPWFRALDAMETVAAEGGTSVIWGTPKHPSYPTIKLNASSLPTASPSSSPAYVPETLTDEEEERTARAWRRFNSSARRKPLTPAPWRELSGEASLEWFHHALRCTGPFAAFTLNLSADAEAKARKHHRSADWIAKRIARHVSREIGWSPQFWFALEISPSGKLHLHGEIGVDADALERVRKGLRTAAGEWDAVRQHQAHTRPSVSSVWADYAAKDSFWMKTLPRQMGKRERPIGGNWFFATNKLRSTAGKLYTARRELVVGLIR